MFGMRTPEKHMGEKLENEVEWGLYEQGLGLGPY